MSVLNGSASLAIYRAVRNIISASLRPAVALPVVAIAILASTLLFQVLFLRAALLGVDRTHRIISEEQELLKLNVDMETGVRGFQYTGNPEFLQPYREAAPAVDSKFATLDQLVSDNPYQRARLASIQGSFEQWKLVAEGAIARRADGSMRDSDEYRFDQMLKGKASMDASGPFRSLACVVCRFYDSSVRSFCDSIRLVLSRQEGDSKSFFRFQERISGDGNLLSRQ